MLAELKQDSCLQDVVIHHKIFNEIKGLVYVSKENIPHIIVDKPIIAKTVVNAKISHVIGISMELIFTLTVVVAGLILPYAGMIKGLT